MRPAGHFVAVVLAVSFIAGCMGPAKPLPDTGSDLLPLERIRGVVTAANPYAAAAGAEVLRQGGNAVDAAAAVQFALNVVEPPMSGIGGGAFMLIRLAQTGQVVVIDGREAAPAAATPDQWQTAPASPDHTWQGLAVGVPGTLAAMDYAVTSYGNLTLATTLEPAVKLARDGFSVNQDLSADIATSRDKLESWPASAKIFLPGSICDVAALGCHGGRPPAPGEKLVEADLAKTFQKIQTDGISAFYQGEIGRALVDAQKVRGGRMTTDDLVAYRPILRQPLVGRYGPYTIYTNPPPGSGLTVLQILGLVEPFHLQQTGKNTAATLHLMMEAAHLSYADRGKYMGDPAFIDVPIQGLLDPQYLSERRQLINRDKMTTDVSPGNPWKYQHGTANSSRPASAVEAPGHTTHFSVVDTWGNVVAVTTTIESAFGSGMVVPGYGFLMNNELTDFSATPGTANEVHAGKRPLSAMSPTIVLRDGAPMMALGSPGSATIIWSVAQVLLNVLEQGLSLPDAVEAGRVSSFAPSTPFSWESAIPAASMAQLEQMGHKAANTPAEIGNVNAVLRPLSGAQAQPWMGVADSSRHGGVSYVEWQEVATATRP